MLYLQNGIYHRREGRIWLPPKSRGLDITSVSQPVVEQHLRGLSPGDFPPLTVAMKSRYVGLSAAMVGYKGGFSVGRVQEWHCRWEAEKGAGEKGGRGKKM